MVAQSITILCVDDEDIPRMLRKLILEKQGYKVMAASSGKEALTMLEQGGINLVLSDQMMPGMTGTELTKAIKSSTSSLPVILVSGVNEIPADAVFADRFVSKVEGPQILFQNVADVLREYGYAVERPA